ANIDHVGMVHLQQQQRGTSARRFPFQDRSVSHGPLKVLFPPIHARVEQGDRLRRSRVWRGSVRPLVSVTVRTGQRQILQDGQAAAAARRRMIDGKGGNLSPYRKPAILAPKSGSFFNGGTRGGIHDAHGCPSSERRVCNSRRASSACNFSI